MIFWSSHTRWTVIASSSILHVWINLSVRLFVSICPPAVRHSYSCWFQQIPNTNGSHLSFLRSEEGLCHVDSKERSLSQRLFSRLTNSTNDTREREKEEQGWICRSSALSRVMLREADVRDWSWQLNVYYPEQTLIHTSPSPLIYLLILLFIYIFN